jgi:two-component system, OmpR family, sensor histidine kinase MtrB
MDRRPRILTMLNRSMVAIGVLTVLAAAAFAWLAHWDAIADALAVALAFTTAGAGMWLIGWMRTRVIRPLFALTATVERYGRGEKQARADERGPYEVSEMARGFNRMAEALATQRSAQLAHLAGVAHDLRNPLWALKLALETVKSADRADAGRVQRGFEVADRQVSRLERMVGDLLDASNIEAGHLELRIGLHDMGELVGELAEQFASWSSKHRIECRVPDAPVPVVIDSLRIAQVVSNLLTNAIKYSPEGTVVEIELRHAQDMAVLEVRDHGLGIEAADLREIFEPFRRVAAGKQRASGTGLGLFVVRRIVEAHGGDIAVESASGCGSTFRVRLPGVQQRSSTQSRASAPSAMS